VQSNFQPLHIIVLMKCKPTSLMSVGDTAPLLRILQNSSKGTTTQLLMASKLWQHGPDWLTVPSLWPCCEQSFPLLVATITATEFVPMVPSQPDLRIHQVAFITWHSTLSKLLTVTAYVLQFVRNLRTFPGQRQTGPVSAEELRLKWIKDTQQTVCHLEITNQIVTHPNTNHITLVKTTQTFLGF